MANELLFEFDPADPNVSSAAFADQMRRVRLLLADPNCAEDQIDWLLRMAINAQSRFRQVEQACSAALKIRRERNLNRRPDR
jgi:hypothetical protein